ncbi:MAG: hypothetical protein ACOC9Y_06095, partial [Chloroflexota bacterium]
MSKMMLPVGYRARTATFDDAPAVARMVAAAELADIGQAEMTTRDLLDDWHEIDLANESVAILDPSDEIVAYADVLNRSYINISIYGHVHP